MGEYRTPGVYVEEISTGPRPIQASATTETGFVGVFALPAEFHQGAGRADRLLIPVADRTPLLSWNRVLAFRALEDKPAAKPDAAPPKKPAEGGDAKKETPPAEPAGRNRLRAIVQESLGDKWSVQGWSTGEEALLVSDGPTRLCVPVRRSMMSSDAGDLATYADARDEQQVLELLAGQAIAQNLAHSGVLACADPKKPVKVRIDEIQDLFQGTASGINGLSGFEEWCSDFARELYRQLRVLSFGESPEQAAKQWAFLTAEARTAWTDWVRRNPGMARLRVSVRGFFENGGRIAHLAVAVQASGAGPGKRAFLENSFSGLSNLAMVVAPGLDLAWQSALLEYAGPRGRGDLFAVLDTPRYLLTNPPDTQAVGSDRWCTSPTNQGAPYEVETLQVLSHAELTELRNRKYSEDAALDTSIPRDDGGYGAAYGPWLVVENPLSTGPQDRYVVAPPSGHVAGMIAATDMKPGGGVHKAPANEQLMGVRGLVTEVSDREQGALNEKGINIIRHRPYGGIRVWGARTVASDPLWRYVNVRRLFLMVERSIRDAVQWAVFLPNTDQTRADLRSTIAGFLFRLHQEGKLDGKSHRDAYLVQCDRENNPDGDVRNGILTVNVSIRPVYPAEFIVLRFRQTPMTTEISENAS